MAVLIVYHLIHFSKEENDFPNVFNRHFKNEEKIIILCIFPVLLTGATMGSESSR